LAGANTLNIITFSLTIINIMTFGITIRKCGTQHNDFQCLF
jgi:hypothetical protein